MQRSTGKKAAKRVVPRAFKNESEEAAWYASPEGRKYADQVFDQGLANGTLKRVKGGTISRSDPAVLAQLKAGLKARRTQAISLRLPMSDIEAAKSIGAEAGIGYQTVLKEIIHQGVSTFALGTLSQKRATRRSENEAS